MNEIREAIRKIIELKRNYESQVERYKKNLEKSGLDVPTDLGSIIGSEIYEQYEDILDNFAEGKPLNVVVDEIIRRGCFYSYEGIQHVLCEVDFPESSALKDSESIRNFFKEEYPQFELNNERRTQMFRETCAKLGIPVEFDLNNVGRIQMIGEAYAKLGIPVEEVPEIAIQDITFIAEYILHSPDEDKEGLKEGSEDYTHYKKLFDIVERAQSELDLRHEKEEQDALKGRTEKIAEAEALVDQQQGQQQE